MLSGVLAFWERAKSGLWLVPSGLVLLAVALAALAVRIRVPVDGSDRTALLWWLHDGSARDAADLLYTLLAAMITMTTLVVSITMVVLTVAATMMGPRLIRHFMADLRTQVVLGLYIATILYVGLVSRSVDSESAAQDVPHVAVTLASTLALGCVLTLLFYVHFLARSVVTDTVIERVGEDLDRTIKRLLPEHGHQDPDFSGQLRGEPAVFSLQQGGYIQVFDYAALVKAAVVTDALLVCDVRPGDYLIPGGHHLRIYPAAAGSRTLRRRIRRSLAVGRDRTPPQDLEFGIRQLVEVALRGLSPGINDPYTALAALDRLSVSLARLMERGPERTVLCDGQGTPRVVLRPHGFAGLVATAFDQIRHAGRERPDILRHLLEILTRLAVHVRNDAQRRVLLGHAETIVESGRRNLHLARDRAVVEDSFVAAREALDGTREAVDRPMERRNLTGPLPVPSEEAAGDTAGSAAQRRTFRR